MADEHTPDETAEDARHVKPFADWLVQQRGGLMHGELTDALNELVQSVTTHGKKGELILKVEIRPATKAAGSAVIVVDDVVVKQPRGARVEALYFHDADFNLTRENPAQPRLPLTEVPKPPASADDDTREDAAHAE